MSHKLQILQIGTKNWSHDYELPENMDWHFFWPGSTTAIRKVMKMEGLKTFSAVLVENPEHLSDLLPLMRMVTPYTIFYPDTAEPQSEDVQDFLKKTCAQATDFSNPAELLRLLSKALFRGQYGDKLVAIDMIVNPAFTGQVRYNGYENLELLGKYGDDFRPLISWKYNIRASDFNPVELWLEYEKDLTCDIRLIVRNIQDASTANFVKERVFTVEDMQSALILDDDFSSFISVSLEARGAGRLKIGALHQRLTRYQFGKYVLGGGIIHNDKREEINYFFYPGDFKPPLNIYFSGYRRAEGFEGFGIMKYLGAPFILFSDPRIDGGAFYLGDEYLENGIRNVIQEYLDLLGFSNKELILSGMSMGTYGSMYYSSFFEPRAVIVAKPLTNLGLIAERGRLEAPGLFPTAFDILRHHSKGDASIDAMRALDDRFWTAFKKADFSQTIFGLSYMKEEDYDPRAFEGLVEALYHSGAHIMVKGTSGRHNDDSATSTTWFMNFYKIVLEQNFGRKF